MFSDRKSIRFSCLRTRRIRAMLNIVQICNKQFISSLLQVQQPIDVRATIQRKFKSLNLWLDTKSEFYSRIAEFPATRRLVIRINLVALCMILAAAAVEQQPAITAVAAVTAAGIVYRINQTDKKQQERKGGKK